ncbi:DUF4157 domain-containing protein [Streptomyces sp. NPDC047043]|uniref:eCIS core domain-containing protein n=1 Tax=Streptomyces sp. NPDC047043 TaxID=3154497 RepID=UPI0033DC0843
MYDHASSRAADRPDATKARRSGARAVAPPEALLALQRAVGNAAVVQMVRQGGPAGAQDRHRHGPGCGHAEEQPPVQRSAVHDVLRSSGQPLDAQSRTDMETRFGADFSDVRIHTDAAAKASAAEVGARAYTSGSHIVAGAAAIDRHTLAHELTHVLQQRKGPVAGTDRGDGLRVSDPSDRFEREAEATARRVLSGTPASAGPAAAGSHAAEAAGPGQSSHIQRVEHPGKIDDEVQRIFDQLESGIDDYLADYGKWSSGNYKWIAMNADLADTIEAIDAYVGEPAGRSKAELATALRDGIRADLQDTSSQTMADSASAAGRAKRKLVLGRAHDTGDWADYQKGKAEGGDRLPLGDRLGRRLNTGKWSVPVNYAFMDGGIQERAVFKILTSLGPRIEGMLLGGQLTTANFWDEVEKLGSSALWDNNKTADEGGPQAMLGHEIVQLLGAGYRFHGRDSKYAKGARLVAVHPDKPAVDPEDKTKPLTIP